MVPVLERLLVVGLGSIGTRHVRLVRELVPGVEIVAWRHGDAGDPRDFGVDHCVTTLGQALEFRPQAAVIANPASHHPVVALPLALAGVHLLVEKPISSTTDGVSELIALCDAAGTVLMTGYNLRFLPSLTRFRDVLRERRIGRVLSVRAETGQFLPSWRPRADYRRGVSAQAALGGGVLLELSHEIDYLRWLFGEVEWVSAIQRKQSHLDVDVEDTAHLTFGFASDGGDVPVLATLSLDFVRHDTTRRCTVIGATGTLRWDALVGTVEIFTQGGSGWESLFASPPHPDESYRAEWRHFLACMADGGAPLVSGRDGLAVLRIIEAARLSSSKGTLTSVTQDRRHDSARIIA